MAHYIDASGNRRQVIKSEAGHEEIVNGVAWEVPDFVEIIEEDSE